MKKRKISFFIVLVILLSQFSQTFGAGQVKNNENSAVYAKIKDQKALEEKKKKEEEQAQEKRELDEEKSWILDSENYYSDRFLVKYTGGKKAKAFAKENFAELAYEEAKKEKAAKEKEVKARIKDGEEQEEFSQMLAGWQESGETDKTKFVESAGGYEVIQLAEKIDPETFMEAFLQESGDGEIYIQPDYMINLASEFLKEPEAADKTLKEPETSDRTLKEPDQETEEKEDFVSKESFLDREKDLREAWKFSKGAESVIALLDTGVDISHPDLEGHMLPGYDFVNERETVYDAGAGMEQAHGTHIAGILAECAPEARILPLKVFENGRAYTSDILEALIYAEEHGASIVNMSFGSAENNQALREAMERAGMFFVCAAGNHHADLGEVPIYPAAFSLENSISVGALNQDLGLSYFSNYGEKVEIAAWGRDVYSCFPEGDYGMLDGTSMAAGYVSAAASLAVGVCGVEGLKKRLTDTADRITCLDGKTAGGKKLSFSGVAFGAVKDGIIEVSPKEDTDETYEALSSREKWQLFEAEKSVAVAASDGYSLAIKENGEVWAWGLSRYGQLGNGIYQNSNQPVRVKGISNIKSISAGYEYAVALKSDGTVYAWGNNSWRQILGSSLYDSPVPVRLALPSSYGKIIKVSAGSIHCLALTENGDVLAWGSNIYGESGAGEGRVCLQPVKITGLNHIVDISAGEHKSMALDSDGNAWAWGKDVPYCVGNEKFCHVPVKIPVSSEKIKKLSVGLGANRALVTSLKGKVWIWGEGYHGDYGESSGVWQMPYCVNTRDELVTEIREVAIGRNDIAILREDGQVLGWGENTCSSLGMGDIGLQSRAEVVKTGIQAVSVGNGFLLMLKRDGTIMAVGDNYWGQCGQYKDVKRCPYPTEVEFQANFSFETAKPLQINEAVCGGLKLKEECRYYSFQAPYTDLYTFESISNFDAYGELYDSSGTKIKYNDDRGNASESTNNRDFYMECELEEGETYYLAVSSHHANYTGTYALKVKYKDDCGDDIQHAVRMEGGSVQGMLDSPGDVDVYSIIPEKTAFYEIQSGSSLGLTGTLMSGSGQVLAFNDRKPPDIGGNRLDFYIYYRLMAGHTYYISVKGGRYSEDQTHMGYGLQVSYKDDHSNGISQATEIQKGTAQNGTIDYAGDVDMFQFVPLESAYYTIESVSGFDAYGALYDASGRQITYNDDGNQKGESANSRDFYIKYLLTANTTYYISVKAYSSTKTGSYELKISVKDDYSGVMSAAFDISERYMTEGNIDYFGDTDTFVFIPKERETYILSTTGNTALDGVLLKVDGNSNTTSLPLTRREGNLAAEIDMKENEQYYFMIYNKDNTISSLGAYRVYVETPLTVTVE